MPLAIAMQNDVVTVHIDARHTRQLHERDTAVRLTHWNSCRYSGTSRLGNHRTQLVCHLRPLFQPSLPRGTIECVLQLLCRDRLDQVVERTMSKRLEREVIVGRHEYHRRHVGAKVRDHIEAVRSGHLNVQEHDVRQLAPDCIDRVSAVVAHSDDLVTLEIGNETSQPELCRRLIDAYAPIVAEVAKRSPGRELVLRRQVADGRREAVFLRRDELVDKVAQLPDELRALFDPLGL